MEGIQRSVDTLVNRLCWHFGTEIADQFKFGSYTRGTILPRCMDAGSDVDYMIVFADPRFRPQTYLNRLRQFVEARYSRSEIAQSHPTIILNLNHIRFELVPAIRDAWGGLHIPAPASDYQDWLATDPNGFNANLTVANQRHNSLIKPVVRVAKYWNVSAGKPFASYDLEQRIVGLSFPVLTFISEQRLSAYFYGVIDGLTVPWDAPAWKRNAVERAKTYVRQAQENAQFNNHAEAERCMQRLLPLPPCGG